MKKYEIYTSEGKYVREIEGTEITSGSNTITIYKNGIIVAILPFTGQFAVLEAG